VATQPRGNTLKYHHATLYGVKRMPTLRKGKSGKVDQATRYGPTHPQGAPQPPVCSRHAVRWLDNLHRCNRAVFESIADSDGDLDWKNSVLNETSLFECYEGVYHW
jgi:hypothetical protein